MSTRELKHQIEKVERNKKWKEVQDKQKENARKDGTATDQRRKDRISGEIIDHLRNAVLPRQLDILKAQPDRDE